MSRDCAVCKTGVMKDGLVHLHELAPGDLFVLRRGRYETYVGRVEDVTPARVLATMGARDRIVGGKKVREQEKENILSPHTEVELWIEGGGREDV